MVNELLTLIKAGAKVKEDSSTEVSSKDAAAAGNTMPGPPAKPKGKAIPTGPLMEASPENVIPMEEDDFKDF